MSRQTERWTAYRQADMRELRFTRRGVIRVLDSYASLLVLLLANFFLLELVDDPRWGAIGSTLLAAAALVVAISDPEAGQQDQRGDRRC